MSAEAAVFYVFATITVAAAAIVVLARSLIYSAFALLFTFFGVAGLYVLLGADFLRGHRVLIAHSQRKMYFTHAGGTVFPGKPSKGCSEK